MPPYGRIPRYFTLRYHGNYVGPGWSAGKYQDSVIDPSVPPVDEFDRTAMEHDAAYARGKRLKAADYKFYRQNIGKGLKRSLAAIAVGTQGYFRSDDSSEEKNNIMRPRRMISNRSRSRGRSRVRTMSVDRSVTPTPFGKRPARGYPGGVRFKIRRLNTAQKFSPGFFKKAGKRKSMRSAGAQSSKSSGFFKKGKRVITPIDKMSKYGVTICREFGSTLGTTAADKAQSMLVGHSTFSKNQLANDVALAMAKLIAVKLNLLVNDMNEPIAGTLTANHQYEFKLSYLVTATAPESTHVFNALASSGITWVGLAGNIQSWLVNALVATSGLKFTKLECYEISESGVAGRATRQFSCDLSRASIDIYSKSSLKIQNRTINTAGNIESDDVDNVPLYGKSYEGSGNFVMYPNKLVVSAASTTNINVAQQFFRPGIALEAPMMEPPGLAAVTRASRVGKVHLDPGQIKTSVLVYRKKFNLNYLLNQISRHGVEASDGTQKNFINIGTFRFFHVEKMIQAVATTDVNGIIVAYEIDQKLGLVIRAPKEIGSTMVLSLNPQ